MVNRAIDVRSAAMLYLAVQIQHESTRGGIVGIYFHDQHVLTVVGRMVKTFFSGEESITDSSSYLRSAVENYNNALVNINVHISIKSYELLKGFHPDTWLKFRRNRASKVFSSTKRSAHSARGKIPRSVSAKLSLYWPQEIPPDGKGAT